MEILRCNGIEKVFGKGGNQVTALNGISLSIEKGEFVAIIGASGSGKSTLLHILGSVDKPTKGTVTIDGVDLGGLNATDAAIFRRRKVGLVYQFYNLIPTLTAEKNILMPMLLDKRKPDLDYFKMIVKTLGIEDKLESLPSQLSGGQQQRVAIARSLIYRPAILFADEPTGNLDSASSKEIMRILKDLHKEGHTVILITHDDQIAASAKRVIRVMDGKIVSDTSCQETENGKKKEQDDVKKEKN